MGVGDWGDSLVGKVLSLQARGSDFDPQNKTGHVVPVYNPSNWKVDTGGSLGLSG